MKILETKHLTKTYGQGASEVIALNNVSISIEKGEFVTIVGASGSGKSTLLHLLGGVDRPTKGEVIINGESIYNYDEDRLAIFRRRQVGLIYQFYNLIPILTVEENISLPLLLDGKSLSKDELKEKLEELGLYDRRNHLPHQLSGGQQQRVSIGRALINNPSIMLADEPTGNLDTKMGAEIINLLKMSNKILGQTIILITHDEKVALAGDRILTISDGEIISDEKIRG